MKLITATALTLAVGSAFAWGCHAKSSATDSVSTTSASVAPTPALPAEAKYDPAPASAPAGTPTIGLSAAVKDAMKSKATAAGWELVGSSGMTLGSQAQTTTTFKKGA